MMFGVIRHYFLFASSHDKHTRSKVERRAGYAEILSLCSLWNNSAMMLKNGEWNGMMSKNCGGTGNGATVEHER